jgi:hypothetical protein
LRGSQVVAGYQGAPDPFLASGGTIVQEGYVTNEVYWYQHELPQWNKRIDYDLVARPGDVNAYKVYANTLVIRPDARARLAPCLRKVIPAFQQATREYVEQPGPTNDLIVKLVKQYNGFVYTKPRADYAVKAMRDLELISNGPDKTVGNFDTKRVKDFINLQLRPIGDGIRFNRIPPDLTPASVETNEFIDPAIGLKPGS